LKEENNFFKGEELTFLWHVIIGWMYSCYEEGFILMNVRISKSFLRFFFLFFIFFGVAVSFFFNFLIVFFLT